jgi:hypothetical protein
MSIYDSFRTMFNPGNRNSQSLDPNQNPNLNPALQNPNTLPQNQQQNSQQTQNPQNNQQQQQQDQTPVDPFKDLWTIDPKQKGPVDLGEFNFSFDQNKVDASINGLDFTKAITPELMGKIAAGGADAQAALLQAMNIVGQQAAKTALMASTRITESGIRTNGQRIRDNLPHLVRNEAVSSTLREDNPLFNDPSTAPMMELITQQMTQKFPNATPAEIRANARVYMANFAKNAAEFTGKQISDAPPVDRNAKSTQTDWSNEPI